MNEAAAAEAASAAAAAAAAAELDKKLRKRKLVRPGRSCDVARHVIDTQLNPSLSS